MRVILEIVNGPAARQRLELVPGQAIRIGRSAKSEFVIADDNFMSGAHFAVSCGPDACILRDLQSTNGTFLNRGKVTVESILRNGDEIIAGESTFMVHIEAPVPQPQTMQARGGGPPTSLLQTVVSPIPSMGPATTVIQRPSAVATPSPARPGHVRALMQTLEAVPEPLYAILDPSKHPSITEMVRVHCPVQQALAAAAVSAGTDLADSLLTAPPPVLVPVQPRSPMLEALVIHGWGQSWGVYLTSQHSCASLAEYLRPLMSVETSTGHRVRLRLYDPRFLRAFLPLLGSEEVPLFFAATRLYLAESDDAKAVLTFKPTMSGVKVEPIGLGSAT